MMSTRVEALGSAFLGRLSRRRLGDVVDSMLGIALK
jgi:hypothetical protein